MDHQVLEPEQGSARRETHGAADRRLVIDEEWPHVPVSGPPLLPVGLLAVRRVKERLPDTPVIGMGGIRTADHVRQYLDAGASLVAIGTAQLADPRLPLRIVRELMHG